MVETAADFFKKRAGKATGQGLTKFLRTAAKTAPDPEERPRPVNRSQDPHPSRAWMGPRPPFVSPLLERRVIFGRWRCAPPAFSGTKPQIKPLFVGMPFDSEKPLRERLGIAMLAAGG